jgi:hypothetical protein
MRFCWKRADNRRILVLVSVLSFFGGYIPLMPVFTKALHGTSATNSLLIGSSEVGAIVAALVLAYLTGKAGNVQAVELNNRLRPYVRFGAVMYGVGMAGFILSKSLPLAMLSMLLVGYNAAIALMGGHAIVQKRLTDYAMCGTVSSVFWCYCYFSMFALGGLATGFALKYWGPQPTVFAMAGAAFAGAVYYIASEMWADKYACPDSTEQTNC